MPRTHIIPIRLDDTEHRIMTEAAKREGLGLGPWLRSAAHRAVLQAEWAARGGDILIRSQKRKK